ncbi:carboxypeptidase-like regulatory domain-containing protein [Solirubrobacter deserti]|uniref:Carboxypeptidase-like regulatory domain-containing protein n=1 Tax=Solirubrobacter deserti TaxID=2282478 RepID=A0ABT4RKD6_9ACTN|nr:carboxypeptidase-like regulatory domain-containing protein [Solirubrobacter deserti]MDA0139016.1 carboxypeptidase-like regulatory domain-containing protein [Solirubrobacter deserti]
MGKGWLSYASAAAVGVCLTLPAVVHAKTYSVWSCRGPAGEPLSAAAWTSTTVNAAAGDVTFADTCAQGGALSVSLAPGREFSSAVVGMAALSAPPGTRIAGYRLWRSLAVAPPQFLRSFDYGAAVAESAGGAAVPYGCSTWTCTAAGDPGDPLAPANEVTQRRAPLDAVRLQVSCERSWCQRPDRTPAQAALYRAQVTLEDLEPPAAPTVSGQLVDGPVAPGAAVLTVSAWDRGGGVESVSLSIDGRPAQTASTGCREPYVTAVPCPTSVAEHFRVDAGALTAGHHTASGTVADAAGNVTGWGPVEFEVRAPTVADPRPVPVTPPAVLAAPAPGPAQALRAAELRLARRSIVHGAGATAHVTGTLRTPRGAPLAGARLEVTSLDLGVDDPEPRPLARVTTDQRGRFTVPARGDGARRITVAFVPAAGSAPAASASVTVRTRLRLSAEPHPGSLVKGRTLTLQGRLRGAGPSARGAIVRVESIVNGRWAPVGVARARADGRYRWRYRFVHLTRDTTFSFRTVVESTPGWPWPVVRSERQLVDVDIR